MTDAKLAAIRLQLKSAVRPAMFASENPEYPVVSQGGTLTLVKYDGRVFGVSCEHVAKHFDWSNLIVGRKNGPGEYTHPVGRLKLDSPIDHAVDSQLMDVALLSFGKEYTADWFCNSPIELSSNTIADSEPNEELLVCGFPADLANFSDAPILGLVDFRVWAKERGSADVVLRTALSATAARVPFSLNGLSGSPVIRTSDAKFCGMVVRGGNNIDCELHVHFVEATDILEILRASASNHAGHHHYFKTVRVLKS